MEDEQYMEDLFNDHAEAIPIAAPHPVIKGFAQRLDELQEKGCCQRIAWSKIGCLASIAVDGRAVNLRNFIRNPADGKWILGSVNTLPLPQQHEEFKIAHLSWGHLGTDLAVLDAAGRILIYSNRNAIGRMSLTRSNTPDHEDELGAIVGLYWLKVFPHQQKSHINWSASRRDNDWAYKTTSHTFQDPHNILEGKSALICVTRTGVVRLLYQQTDSSWHEVPTDLNSLHSAKDMFTHAAFTSSNDDCFLLAAYDVSDQLHLYRIKIHWSAPTAAKWSGPQQAPAGLMTAPILDISFLHTEGECLPVGPSHDDLNSTSSGPQATLPVQLTHLNFLSPVSEQAGVAVNPMIVATFSHSPSVIASLDQTQSHQNPFSIISRWEYDSQSENRLHASLDLLASGKKPKASDVVRLKRQEETYTSAVVLSVVPVMYNTILAMHQSDGSIEFRSTTTMDPIHADYGTDKVTSLPQAGFAFSMEEAPLYVALSANCCLAATMSCDGAVKIKTMTYVHGSLGSVDDDPKHDAAIAAIALQHTSSCNQYFSGDDIFAIVPEDLPASRVYYLLNLLFHSMSVNIDCVGHNPQESICAGLGKNPAFVRCLSAQNTLGYISNNIRKLPANLAWATLNIRHISIITLLVFNYHRGKPQQGQLPGQQLSLLRPEMATSLIGLSSWMVDFLIWVIDDIIRLAESLRNQFISQASVQAKLMESNSPCLLILLSSVSRGLLREWQKALNWMQRSANSVVQSDKVALDVRNHYTGLLAAFSERPPIWRVYEVLISEIENLVVKCYLSADIKDSDRARVERDMFIKAEVPDCLMPVVKQLLTKVFLDTGGILEKMNPADIIFRDFSWLGVTAQSVEKPDRRAQAFEKKCMVDVLRKTTVKWPKKGAKKVKRCTRGCAYCEDLLHESITSKESAQMGPWYWHMSKSCVCGNGWTVVESPVES